MASQNPVSTSSLLPSSCTPRRSAVSPSPSPLLLRQNVFSFFRASSPRSDRRLPNPNFSLTSKLHRTYPHRPSTRIFCKAVDYVFPDPIPEFSEAETSKFRAHLLERLSKKDMFDDSLEEIVCICTEILSNFLHAEYGGPGTLMVVPFIDMADTINEKGLSGGPQAARAAFLWAQKHIDKDWKDWTGDPNL